MFSKISIVSFFPEFKIIGGKVGEGYQREKKEPHQCLQGPGAPRSMGHNGLRHPEQAVARRNQHSCPKHPDQGSLAALKWAGPSKSRLSMCSTVSEEQRRCKPLTCQAAVHHVVLPPKPENSLVWGFHRIHGLLSHFLKMLTTFFAPKECVNVSPYGL